MAPEVLSCLNYSLPSDVYSFGCIIDEFLYKCDDKCIVLCFGLSNCRLGTHKVHV